MYNVKLAPLKGLSKEEVRSERLESLTELMLIDTIMSPGTNNLNHSDSITDFEHNRNHSPESIDSSGDSNYHTRAASPGQEQGTEEAVITKEEEFIRSSPRALHNNYSTKLLSNNINKVQKPSPLGVNDVNNLWTIYLNQQQKLGGKDFLKDYDFIVIHIKRAELLKLVVLYVGLQFLQWISQTNNPWPNPTII